MKSSIIVFFTLLFSSMSFAGDIPIRHVNFINIEGLTERLRNIDWLADLDEKNYGASILLLSSFDKTPTASGTATGATTAILSSSTLGIIPVITNDDFTLRFEIMVHGDVVSTYTFHGNFSDVQNLWTAGANAAKPLEGEARDWIFAQIPDLKKEIESDSHVRQLSSDYKYYFEDTKTGLKSH